MERATMTIEQQAVRDLVARPPVEVEPDATLRSVAETMTEELIGVVVVRGTRPAGARGDRAEGVVSERDIVRSLAEGLDPDESRAEDVMTMQLASASPTSSVLDVAAQMLDNEIRHVPVIEAGVVVGVVSERDALRALFGDR